MDYKPSNGGVWATVGKTRTFWPPGLGDLWGARFSAIWWRLNLKLLPIFRIFGGVQDSYNRDKIRINRKKYTERKSFRWLS